MNTNSDAWKAMVRDGLGHLGLTVGDRELDLLFFHADEMLKWNKTTNLTAIKDPEDVAIKHVVDACFPAAYCRPDDSVLDMGSGAGFPGIPLKILLPALQVTLVETVRKKVSFLKHVIRSAGLTGIDAIQARAEVISSDPAYAGRFDVVTCRAFTSLDAFVNMAIPYMKEDGCILAMKGPDAVREAELLKDVDARLHSGRQIGYSDLRIEQIRYNLPVIQAERVLFIIRLAGQD